MASEQLSSACGKNSQMRVACAGGRGKGMLEVARYELYLLCGYEMFHSGMVSS